MHFIKYDLNATQAKAYLTPFHDYSLDEPITWTDSICDPFRLHDMKATCEKLISALSKETKILICGDYDLDGMSAASSLYLTFLRLRAALWQMKAEQATDLTTLLLDLAKKDNWHALIKTSNFTSSPLQNERYNLAVYIPDRLQEGYSLSQHAVDYILKNQYELVITVDCGVKSAPEIAQLKASGLCVLVTDHHECPEILPPADLVVNPKRLDEQYPNRDLSGSGVVFKLAQALEKTLNLATGCLTNSIVEIAALGLISDVMPLTFENWQIIRAAPNKLQHETGQIGLSILLAKLNLQRNLLTYSDIAFYVCPKFNACGRIDDAYLGLRCLLTDDKDQVEQYVLDLLKVNAKRQSLTEKYCEEAEAFLYSQPEFLTKPILSVPLHSAHSGIIGLVAARLQTKYLKPCLCFTEVETEGKRVLKASGRSYGNFNLYEAISNLQAKQPDLFVSFGGHALAVGLSIYAAKFNEFNNLLNESVQSQLEAVSAKVEISYDSLISAENGEAILPNVEDLKKQLLTEPYGPNRPLPIYLYAGKLKSANLIGSQARHSKMLLDNGIALLAFNQPLLAKIATQTDTQLNLLFTANLHEFRHTISAQYIVKGAYIVGNLNQNGPETEVVSTLEGLNAKQIYTILADFYNIIQTYGEMNLLYLDIAAFGEIYYPCLTTLKHNGEQAFRIGVNVVCQCLQILRELNIIESYKLTDKVQLLKFMPLKKQLSLQTADTFKMLVAK